ncbi:uncharacterized protein LOC105702346 [Orussus abietinus]|uniref:uncharacterized protein LOC105702346 n=1 Tax=Orussus abietinus TaxID=222816 RepID=UPI000626ECBD|nr:uncharacterized protein LOC105702346 [Orussus abietinus]
MKRVNTIAQTINLSKPKTCIRPGQVQKLVSTEIKEPCPRPKEGKAYEPPKPVTIKLCTRKELQGTCAPKLCDCPQKPPPETKLQKLCRWLNFGLKCSVTGGLVNWTYSIGLWGSSEKTEDIYRGMISELQSIKKPPVETEEDMPKLDGIMRGIFTGYNRVVMGVIGLMVGVPMKIHEKISDVLFPCDMTENMEYKGKP